MSQLDQSGKVESSPTKVPARISIRTQLLVFFLLSFLIGWLAWLPLLLNPMQPQPASIIGLFAPALSAIIVAWWAQGKAGVATIFKRYLIWRFHAFWYLFALLLLAVLYCIGLLIVILNTHVAPGSFFMATSPFFVLAAYVYLMVINSGEEIGWRGFALPLLESQLRSPLLASLVLGVLWAIWHFPLYANPALATMPYLVFFFFSVGLSVIYMQLFHQTKGSLLPMVMLHASTDVLPRIVLLTHVGTPFWIIVTILTWIVAIVMTLLLKPGQTRTA